MAAAVAVRRAGGRFLLSRAGDGLLAVSRALAEGPDVDAPPAAAGGREPAASAMAARVTPAVLFVTVVLAVVLLASGLMHVLRRLFLKSHHGDGGGADRQRQLQHLFFPGLEDGGGGGGGLDQAAIAALPEFAYAELSGAAAAAARGRAGKGKAAAAADADSSRPFDCAVCLSEFAGDDRLRLLPLCGHAFHVACIDVWLRSSATCPLCRTKLSRHLAAIAATPDTSSAEADIEEAQHKQQDAPSEATAAATVVLPVRLGRFKNTTAAAAAGDDAEASTSASSRIDARRCYSMGSYQYVLSDEQLLVSVHVPNGNAGGMATGAGVPAAGGGDQQGKKVFARGDSFSVSKIWQRRGSDKRLPSLCACGDDGLPWAPPARDQSNACTTRQQESDT